MPRRFAVPVLLVALSACSTTRAPSPPLARVATPKTVNVANPAGDAAEPEDAAATRLLRERAAERRDRTGALSVWLADAAQWRRVKLLGHPTRATHRYGDEHYAIDSVDYRAADGEDSPEACLQRFVDRARDEANRYGVVLGPVDHGHGQHPRGVESIDWEKRRTRLVAAVPPPSPAPPPPAPGPSSAAPPPLPAASAPPVPALLPTPASLPPTPKAPLSAAALLSPRGVRGAPLGMASMPYVRGSGEFTVLFTRRRYVGAVAAYKSWPGTCLVHSFAVQVGTDEALANQVVDRFLEELAPRTGWTPRARRAPPFDDR